nr:outer membrane beta-barrel protein [Desulfobacula sp.]
MNPCCRVLLAVFLAAEAVFGFRPPAAGGPTELVPRISLREEYKDNLLFTKDNKKKDLLTIASGGIRVERKTERLNANADAGVRQLMFNRYDELDSMDKSVGAGLDYRVTERLTLGASGAWKADSIRGYDEDISGVSLNGDREVLNLSLTGGYHFSEIGRADLSLDMDRSEIQRSLETEDLTQNQVRLEYAHNLSRFWNNTTGLLGLNYTRYASEIMNQEGLGSLQEYDSDIWQFTVGFSKELTELLSFYVQTGVSYTETLETVTQNTFFGPLSSRSSADSLGGVAAAGITYKTLYYDAALSFSHDVRGGSGSNGAVERTFAAFDLSGRITEDFRATLNLSGSLSRNDRKTGEDLDELTLTLQPGFRYEISDDLYLAAGYRFISRENRQNDTLTEGSLVYFEVTRQFNYDID